MTIYLEQVRKYQSYFDRVVVMKILREANTRVDDLSKIASGTDRDIKALHQQIIVLFKPSITLKSDIMELDATPIEPKWAIDIIQYLKNGLLPEDKARTRKIKVQVTRYSLLGGILYKRGYSEPLLKCLSKTKAEYVMKEIHEGVCGNHSGGQMLVHKGMRAGYYWPSMSKDLA
jgi:hypothetical protein